MTTSAQPDVAEYTRRPALSRRCWLRRCVSCATRGWSPTSVGVRETRVVRHWADGTRTVGIGGELSRSRLA